jgi:trimethylamine--corrinoid protein Co-methyltransferase
MTERATRQKTRSGGRAGAAARRGAAVIEQMPWNPPVMIDPPVEPLRPEGVEAIHDGAMRILEEIGVQFLNAEALTILREAGCRVDGDIVRMDRAFVMAMVRKAPAQFTLTPRNLDRAITIGGQHLNFGNVSSPPIRWDASGSKM